VIKLRTINAHIIFAAFAHISICVAVCIASLSVLSVPVNAQANTKNSEEKLRKLENEIKESERQQEILRLQAQRAETAASALSEKLILAARRIQQAESNVSQVETRIEDLENEMAAKRQTLLTNNQDITELVAALQRMSKRPAVLSLLKPDEAIVTARSASVLGALVPLIDDKTDILRIELEALSVIQADLSNERFSLKDGLQRLTENQRNIASLLSERRLEAGTATERAAKLRQETAKVSREAKDLRDLIAKLAQQAAKNRRENVLRDKAKRSARPGGKLKDQRGLLPYPVIGPIVTRFGGAYGAGHSKGIRIRTRAGAQVIAPFDGQIVFAGQFRNYGLLLIIDHGDGYHSLVSGFESLQASVGQWVLTGEPIGIMPSDTAKRELYLELRRNGAAINPAPWLKSQTASTR
jgi:septal ring factor EnvC (AmiA/AmiB activator)